MRVATLQAATATGAAAVLQRSRQAARGQLRHWLPVILFTVLIGAQTVARTGDFAGFVDSTKPARIPSQTFTTADGYVLFWDGIPVNGDATSFLFLTRFMQGQQEPEGTGIYDLRAGYAYVGALASLLLGHYRSFVALNALAWLGAALAMYWLGGRLLDSRLAAWTAGTLTATGQGFSFMVGTPVSTLLGFASVALLLAFVEWAGLLQPPFRWRDWLHTGWLIAAVSLIYPVYLALLAFIWLYGLRRAPFVRLLGLGAVTLGLAQAWPIIGATVVGLQFDTTNSALLGAALHEWWSAILHGLRDFLRTVRLVASAGTIYAAFPRRDGARCCVWLCRCRATGSPVDARIVPGHTAGSSVVHRPLRDPPHGILCVSGNLPASCGWRGSRGGGNGKLALTRCCAVSGRCHTRPTAAGGTEPHSACRLWGS